MVFIQRSRGVSTFSGSRVRNNWGSEFRELAKSFMELRTKYHTLLSKPQRRIRWEQGVGPIMQNVFHTQKKNPSYCLCGPSSDVALWHLIKICAVNVLEKKNVDGWFIITQDSKCNRVNWCIIWEKETDFCIHIWWKTMYENNWSLTGV